MSDADHEPSIPAPTPEVEHGSEAATEASNEWLKERGNGLKRWLGHGVRFVGSELAINLGSGLATFGALGSLLTGNPFSLLFLGGGSALAAGGVAAEWKSGMKHAESDTEKKVFWLSKFGQTVGTGTLIGLGLLASPTYAPLATGLYLAGVGMGARAVSHRE